MTHVEVENMRYCHTCTQRKGKLIELNFIDGLKHRLKGHWVRHGSVTVKTRVGGGIKFHVDPKP